MDGITIICPVICPYCGATIKPDYRFCMVCGLILEAFFSECRDCGDRGHHWFYGDKEKLYCSQCGSRRIINIQLNLKCQSGWPDHCRKLTHYQFHEERLFHAAQSIAKKLAQKSDEEQAAKVIDYSFAKAGEFFKKPFEYDFQLDLHFTPSDPDCFKCQIQNLIDSVREQTEQVIFERVFLQLIVLHGIIFLHETDSESISDNDPATPTDTSG